jgi:hypothetical protein
MVGNEAFNKLMPVRASRVRYQDYLESEKAKRKQTAEEQQNKRRLQELMELEARRQRLECDARVLETEVDNWLNMLNDLLSLNY